MTRPPPPSGLVTADEWHQQAIDYYAASQALQTTHPRIAVYLAGFAVELMIKAKTLKVGKPLKQTHDLRKLLSHCNLAKKASQSQIPSRTPQAKFRNYYTLFRYVTDIWDNQLRYAIWTGTPREVEDIIRDTRVLMDWIWTA